MKLKNKYGFKHIDLIGKFCIPVTPATSRMIQELVFELGGGWGNAQAKLVKYDDRPFLVLECKKEIELYYLKKLGKNHKEYQLVADKDMIIKLLRALVYKQSHEIRKLSRERSEDDNG